MGPIGHPLLQCAPSIAMCILYREASSIAFEAHMSLECILCACVHERMSSGHLSINQRSRSFSRLKIVSVFSFQTFHMIHAKVQTFHMIPCKRSYREDS